MRTHTHKLHGHHPDAIVSSGTHPLVGQRLLRNQNLSSTSRTFGAVSVQFAFGRGGRLRMAIYFSNVN